jgi:RNA polymerase sigma factor (sigma-70 family)
MGELVERFEEQRATLRAIAYRMLGSGGDAEDAVQEAWLRLGRVDPREIGNLPAWLRTTVTRICLDMLRSRQHRREDPAEAIEQLNDEPGRGPEDEALLADSVSRALLLVLEALDPAERIALVLHDMFSVPFAQIAPIVQRTPSTTKKLASRARQKVRGTPAVPATQLARHRRVVSAFLTAARAGDLTAILAVLAPEVVRRADPAALAPGAAAVVRGAHAVAEGTVALAARSQAAEQALVDGDIGLVVVAGGRLRLAVTFGIEDDRIVAYHVIADPDHLNRLNIAVLDLS